MSADRRRRWFMLGAATAAALPQGLVRIALAGPSPDAVCLLCDPRHFDLQTGQGVPLDDAPLTQFDALLATPGAIAGLSGYVELTVMADLARRAGRTLAFHAYYNADHQVSFRIVTDRCVGRMQAGTCSMSDWQPWLAARLLEPGSRHTLPRQRTDRMGCTIHAWRFTTAVPTI